MKEKSYFPQEDALSLTTSLYERVQNEVVTYADYPECKMLMNQLRTNGVRVRYTVPNSPLQRNTLGQKIVAAHMLTKTLHEMETYTVTSLCYIPWCVEENHLQIWRRTEGGVLKKVTVYTSVKEKCAKYDKYYTKEGTAHQCRDIFFEFLRSEGIDPNDVFFIEPSAGGGVFVEALRSCGVTIAGFDIFSMSTLVKHCDFLRDDFRSKLTNPMKKPYIFIGNPPFGTKGKLAGEFINRCFEFSDHVGFILPNQFKKRSAQTLVNVDAKLVVDVDLPEDGFTFMEEEYKIRCSFQVWTKKSEKLDLRIRTVPPTEHPDFEIYQYNRTEEAKKFFAYAWDFAVPRQGRYDYTTRIVKGENLNPDTEKRQLAFFKAKNEIVRERLFALDFVLLSKKNASTPGFGKADVVELYTSLYGA